MQKVEKLTQRLDHMVPERVKAHSNKREIKAFLEAIAKEEKRILSQLK